MRNKTLIAAAWIAPMTGPLIHDGGVVFAGDRVAAVGAARALRDLYPDAERVDLGNVCLLPGLVNAHTHLELSSIKRGESPKRFVDWIIGLMSQTSGLNAAESTAVGIAQCIRFGVTSVGDITSQPNLSRIELEKSPLTGVSYGEVRAMAQRRGFLEPRIAAATASEQIQAAQAKIKNGISPHAPYSIEIDGYRRCLTTARQRNLPLATHLAETPDEAQFLSDQTGPFRELWEHLDAWDDQVPRFTGGPIRFAEEVGLLDYPTLLAHVNYCDDSELDLLIASQASVVYCPRTHAFFGHPPHRWREMLARGINVAVGTDSCASSPDLNLVDELRLLHHIDPEVPAMELWHMATTRAARAIAAADVGSFAIGNRADATAFAVTGDDPLLEILQQPRLPIAVWAGGQRINDTGSYQDRSTRYRHF